MSEVQIVEIERIVEESHHTKTFRFSWDVEAKPGQFVMVWIPGVDEVPMSLSYNRNLKGITVHRVGEATNALHQLKVGDKIGIRGPFGNGFEIRGRKVLTVAGGTGMASVITAVEECFSSRRKVVTAVGAKTGEELLFLRRARKCGKVHISTDDGSLGHKGLVSDLAARLLEAGRFDQVLTCGPEVMMKKVVQSCLSKGIEVQASLERYMRCGMGICDSCAFDGLRVCKDGPVFDGKKLLRSRDFAVFRREPSGRRIRM